MKRFFSTDVQVQRDRAFSTASGLSPQALAEFREEIDRLVEKGASFVEAKEVLGRLADRHPIVAVQGAA